ncbi:hypothetical protein ACFQX6_44615 [Streptosporangium lutulentum]
MREGLSWIYRHRTLAPMAVTSHAWFLFHSMLGTVFVAYALDARELDLGAFWLGAAYACGGVGAFLGGALAGWAGRRFDAGPTVIAAHALMALAWALMPLAVPGLAVFVMVALSQFLFWVAMGVTGPNELGYRQSVTPDGLQGRMNTTIRSSTGPRSSSARPSAGFWPSRPATGRHSGSASPGSFWWHWQWRSPRSGTPDTPTPLTPAPSRISPWGSDGCDGRLSAASTRKIPVYWWSSRSGLRCLSAI